MSFEPGAQRILVTGASGFVGAHLALTFAGLGFGVFGVGGKHRCPAAVEHVCACVNADIAQDAARLLEWARPDVVVHAAALANAAACESDPALAERSNVGITKALIDAAKQQGLPLFIQISTDLVFDGAEAPPEGFSETAAPKPLSVYAITKREAECAALEFDRTIVARICLVYGNQVGTKQGFLGWILENVQNAKPVKLFVDEFRTPIFAEDAALALQAIIRAEQDRLSASRSRTDRIVHIAGPQQLSRYDFGLELSKTNDFSPALLIPARQSETPTTPPRPKNVSLNIVRLKQTYNFTPRPIQQCLNQMKANRNQES